MRQLELGGNGGRKGRLWPLLLWTGVILLVVVPWTSYQDHTHWARVQWIPFVSFPIKLSDIVGNVLLYVPFGYLSMQVGPVPRAGRAVALAFLLSFSTEYSQLYSHGRFPSTTDLTCNVFGAWLGTRRRATSAASTAAGVVR